MNKLKKWARDLWFWICIPFAVLLDMQRWNSMTPEAQEHEARAMMKLGTDIRLAAESLDDITAKLKTMQKSQHEPHP